MTVLIMLLTVAAIWCSFTWHASLVKALSLYKDNGEIVVDLVVSTSRATAVIMLIAAIITLMLCL